MCSSLEELDGLVGGYISPKLWEEIEALNRTELVVYSNNLLSHRSIFSCFAESPFYIFPNWKLLNGDSAEWKILNGDSAEWKL